MNRDSARDILDQWRKEGIDDDPEKLRMLLSRRGNSVFARFAVQLSLDLLTVFATYQGFQAVARAEDFFGKGLLLIVLIALTANYTLAFLSNAVSLYFSVSAMNKFGTDAGAFLTAVKQIAGEGSSIETFDKVVVAVDAVKVVQALESIDKFIKASASDTERVATLDSLAIYLTLSTAREKHGFEQDKLGLSDEDAANIAYMFSKYDANDDFRLDRKELQALCMDAGRPLSDAEVPTVLSAMDENGNGYIEFNEFASFWVNPTPKVAEAARLAALTDKKTSSGDK